MLQDLRKTRVWREAFEEGLAEGLTEGRDRVRKTVIQNCLSKGMSVNQIAKLTHIPLKEARRLAKDAAK